MPLSNRSPDTTNELRHHRGVGRARSPRPRSLFQRPPHPRRRHGTGQTRTFVRHVRLVRRTRVSVLSGRPSAAWYRCPGGRVFQRGFSWQMSRSAWPLASHVRVMCPISRMTITPLACASLMARQNAFCRAACCWVASPSQVRAPEVGLPLLGGPRRPQRKLRASTSSRRSETK